MNKLFDDTPYIVHGPNKQKWKRAFQKYCDSDKIREESSLDGLNSCGYWYACDECNGSGTYCPCATALMNYIKDKDIVINFDNISEEYLDKVLRGDFKDE